MDRVNELLSIYLLLTVHSRDQGIRVATNGQPWALALPEPDSADNVIIFIRPADVEIHIFAVAVAQELQVISAQCFLRDELCAHIVNFLLVFGVNTLGQTKIEVQELNHQVR